MLLLLGAIGMAAYRRWERQNWRIPWEAFSAKRVADELKHGRPVLVNFRARWDFTTAMNGKWVINQQETRELIRERGIIALDADWTDQSVEITEALRNLGQLSIPVFAIYSPGRPEHPTILRGLIQPADLASALRRAAPQKLKPDSPLSITHFGLIGVLALFGFAWALAINEQRQSAFADCGDED